MRKFKLKANQLSGVYTTVNAMSPKDKADTVGGDAVDAVETMDKCVDELIKANQVFFDAVKRTEDAKMAKHKEFTDRYNAAIEGKEPAEKSKIGADMTIELTKELNEIQSKSEAKGDVEVEVEISDAKWVALCEAMRKVIGSWVDSKMYVETARIIDKAEAC